MLKVSGTNSNVEEYTFGYRNEPSKQVQESFRRLLGSSMSPSNHKLLDIRMTGSSLESFEVSIEEAGNICAGFPLPGRIMSSADDPMRNRSFGIQSSGLFNVEENL
ncbi:hypothetical protein L484_004736 [Morus notabilis]|uniref:Uncharacterized protein n=1 Tax=Morus notabilis TaxID=981085 RepID=W9S9E5_9ROSA|nr:hypothetical protein L484_004736 [Morus notabilis]